MLPLAGSAGGFAGPTGHLPETFTDTFLSVKIGETDTWRLFFKFGLGESLECWAIGLVEKKPVRGEKSLQSLQGLRRIRESASGLRGPAWY